MTARGKKRLLDAERRVEEAVRGFDVDPERTLEDLRHLQTWFEPDPNVLHALTLHLHRHGEREPAVETSRRALSLCVERGYTYLAAEMFHELRLTGDELGEDKEGLLTLATFVAREGDLAGAARAYSWIVRLDPDGPRAVKGLLDIAERILSERGRPDAARRVYAFLLKNCPQSLFATAIREGLDYCDGAVQEVPVSRS